MSLSGTSSSSGLHLGTYTRDRTGSDSWQRFVRLRCEKQALTEQGRKTSRKRKTLSPGRVSTQKSSIV